MNSEFRSIRFLDEWIRRGLDRVITLTPTVLGIGVIVPGVDLIFGGPLDTLLPWYTLANAVLLGLTVVLQAFVCSGMMGLAGERKRYWDVVVWFLLAAPALAFLFLALWLIFNASDGQTSYSAGLASLHITQRTVDGINMTLGGWVSVVALRLNPAIKKQQKAEPVVNAEAVAPR